jgi:two-component system, sensor histidine kinase and response regulator
MSTPPAHLLIVDDTPANLQLLLSLFNPDIYHIRVATNGTRALQLSYAEPPDLILLDIIMPDLSGYEVCRQLKATPATANIPIIFLTALQDVENKLQGFELGGVDYITKPFHAAEVLSRVNTHLTLRHLQQQLLQTNEQLQRQLLELDAYAHTVAHDLKSPLSALMGLSDLLAQEAENLPADVQKQMLSTICRSSHKMNEIIEELLLLATIRQQQTQTIPAEPLDMWAIVTNAVERVQVTMEEADGMQLTLDQPKKWPMTLGYAPWVEEVWVNYLSNALKYGGEPPRITIGGQSQGNMARFWVQDNGQGLTPTEQSQLFAPFERLKQTRAQGHGLGLSIVRRIIETLGGTVGVESELGAGSIFYFTLPHYTT